MFSLGDFFGLFAGKRNPGNSDPDLQNANEHENDDGDEVQDSEIAESSTESDLKKIGNFDSFNESPDESDFTESEDEGESEEDEEISIRELEIGDAPADAVESADVESSRSGQDPLPEGNCKMDIKSKHGIMEEVAEDSTGKDCVDAVDEISRNFRVGNTKTSKPRTGIELGTKEEFLKAKTTEALKIGTPSTEKEGGNGDLTGSKIISADEAAVESNTGARPEGNMDMEKQRVREPNISSRPKGEHSSQDQEYHNQHGSSAADYYSNYPGSPSQAFGTMSDSIFAKSGTASTALESDISDIIEKNGIFKEVRNLYRAVKVVSDQQDTLMIEKALIEGEQLWHICKDAGYENQCAMDASSIDFSVLNNCQLEFTGVFGSKAAIIEFLSHYENSKSVVTALGNSLTEDNQKESFVPAGVYVWINRSAEYPSEDQVPSEVSAKALTKAGGVAFVWPGQFNIFENSSKSSMITTLVRYLMDLSSCDIVLAMTEQEFSDFDPKNVSEFQKIMSEVRGVTIKKTTKQDNFEIYESPLRLGYNVKHLGNPDASVSFTSGNRQISVVVTRKKDSVTKREQRTEHLNAKQLLAFIKNNNRVSFVRRVDMAEIQYKIARCLPDDCKLGKIIANTERMAQQFDNAKQESLRELDDDLTKKVDKLISSTKHDLSLALKCIDGELPWEKAKFKGDVEMRMIVREFRRACLCKQCRKVLKGPVMMECGCTLCQKCVTTLVKTSEDEVSCPVCNRKFKKGVLKVVDDEVAAEKVKKYWSNRRKYKKTCSKESIEKKFKNELKQYSESKKNMLKLFKYVLRSYFLAFQQLLPSAWKDRTEEEFKNSVQRSQRLNYTGLRRFLKKNTRGQYSIFSSNPYEYEWENAIRKAKTQLKLDNCDTEKARKVCLDKLVERTKLDVKEEYKIDGKRKRIMNEHRKNKADLKEGQRKELNEEFRKMYKENEKKDRREVWVRKFIDFPRYTTSGYGYYESDYDRYKQSSYCLTFDIDVTTEGAYENTIFRYFPKNMTAVISGLSEEGDKCPKMEGKFGQVKRWNSPPSGDETIFLYELGNQANLRLVHRYKHRGKSHAKTFTYVFLDPPAKKNLGSTSWNHALHHFAGKPILVRFEESKGLLIIYRRYKIGQSFHDELGIYKVDVDKNRLMYHNNKYDLGRNFSQPENEDVPMLKDFFIVPNKNEIVMLRYDGTFWKLDIQSRVVETCPNRRKIDLKRNRNVHLFCTPDPLMIVIYWDSEEKVWVLEGCLLSNRSYDDGKVISMFHPFKRREFKEFPEESSFSMLMQSPIHLLMILDKKTRNISTFRLSIQVFESKIQQRIQFNNDGCDAMPKSNCLLNYIYYTIFKFPTRNGVVSHLDRPEKNIHLCISREAPVTKKTQREVSSYYNDICAEISKTAKNLKADLNYEFSSRKGVKLTKDFVKETMSTMIADDESEFLEDEELRWRLLGNWLQDLICLIPIQVARHYFGDFKPLCNGLPIGFDDIVDSLEEKQLSITDYAREIRFGLLETVFRANADKQVYVISCVGTQSSGKSTLLNNLGGRYFNIGAGRCTDGIWMSVAVTSDNVFVLLDFEGLGSFEKTCEQDMLSSLFGAAVSNIFIVRTTMHFDNFTKNTLGLWAKGARHLKFKKSKLLFNGKIVLNPRDVDAVESRDVNTEFLAKFQKTLNVYEESIQKERDGNNQYKVLEMFVEWMIKPTEKNNTIGYYNTLFKFLDESVLGKPNFKGSCEFMDKSKIFLAQLAMKDFSSIDEVYVKTIIEDVLNMKNDVIYGGATSLYPISKISFGSIESWKQSSKHLKEAFRSASNLKDDVTFAFVVECEGNEIEVLKAHCGEIKLHLKFEENRVTISFDNLSDSGLVLGPVATSRKCYLADKESFWKNIIKVQLEFFKREFPLRKETALVWFKLFGSFLTALAGRRNERACSWARNRLEKLENREAKNLLEQFELEANGLVKKLQLCGTKCNVCFLRCCLQVGHDTKNHDCLQDNSRERDHKCQEFCHYCQSEEGNDVACKLLAGHIGFCHCAGKPHECGKLCSLSKFFGCSRHCYLEAKHEGECMCKTEKGRHLCGQPCTLNGCNERCISIFDEKHDKHVCHRNKCPRVCELCSEECASNNHFHAMDCPDDHHLCRNEHRCPIVCEHPGTCEISTFAIRRPIKGEFRTHDGRVVSFEEFSLQNGEKKKCGIKIPPGETKHEGPHTCMPSSVIEGMEDGDECQHTCNVKCSQCGYFCTSRFGHEGLHECTHGNMRNARFLVEEGKDSDEMLVKVFQDDTSNSGEETKKESQTPKSNFQIHKIGHGSSGKFTTCMLGCMAKEGNGRGHVHLVRCKFQSKEECDRNNMLIAEHLRHQTCVYDKDVMYDEVKCKHFWEEILKFKTSFSPEEMKQFNLCNCKCGLTQIHNEEENKEETEEEDMQKENTDGGPKIPFCMLPLWHKPVGPREKPEGYEGEGYVSTDGHFFPCSHGLKGGYGACHSYFIIDNSGSMADGDVKPSTYDWITRNPNLNNRLGLVIEAVANYVTERENKCQDDLFSLITFNSTARRICSGETVSYMTVKNRCRHLRPTGGTYFMEGFKSAISEFEKRSSIDSLFTSVFILFTDGEDCGSQSSCLQLLREMCEKHEGIRIHTIGFGARGMGYEQYLKDIAEIGGGSYHLPGDAVEVVGSFSAIAQNPTKSAFGVCDAMKK